MCIEVFSISEHFDQVNLPVFLVNCCAIWTLESALAFYFAFGELTLVAEIVREGHHSNTVKSSILELTYICSSIAVKHLAYSFH